VILASVVDICNLALAHLGDAATVASIDPPSGDIQSSHCARFYPIARDALLEMHTWGFATQRSTMALAAQAPPSTWKYAYTPPSNVINYIEILDPQATDEYSTGVQMANTGSYAPPVANMGVYSPYAFEVESDSNGNDILYTNLQYAVLRYTTPVTDTTKFSPLFTVCLSHLLASMLAGPLIKGAEGIQISAQQLKLSQGWQQAAEGSDANQRYIKPAPGAPWMVNR
jgi:hypothetical protein